jgi:hypothetical protein
MRDLVKILSIISFLSATITVAGIFYEGLVLKWFTFIGVSMHVTDILFLMATIAGVFYYKSNKLLFYSHLFSMLVILAGIIIMMILGEKMPIILVLLWEFYILYFYGIVVSKKLWKNQYLCRKHYKLEQ